MTKPPSGAALADEIERLSKEATPLSAEDCEGMYLAADATPPAEVCAEFHVEADRDLFIALRNNAPALVAALRSLADMREALEIGTPHDAYDNLLGASEDLSNSNGNDEITRRTIRRVLGQLAKAQAALARGATPEKEKR